MNNNEVRQRLPKTFRPFLLMHTGYLIFFNLPFIFINTFFLSIVDDVRFTYLYNILFYIVQGAMMVVGALVLRKYPSRYCARIGIFTSSIGYLLLLLLRENSVSIMPLLALIMGTGGAFYWTSFSMIFSDTSSDSTRDKAYSSIGITGSIVSLIIPFSSGKIISAFMGNTGYFIVFGLAFTVAILTVILSMFITENSAPHTKSKFKESISLIKEIKSTKFSYMAIVFLGLREGSASFVLNILLFQMLKDESIVGINALLTGGATIFANMLCYKIMKPKNRVKVFNISTTILLVACLFMSFYLNTVVVIGVAMITAALTALMNNAANAVYFSTFDENDETITQLRPEMFAIKEVIFAVGRVVGILILYVVPTTFTWCTIGLIILTVLQYITGYFCKKSVDARMIENNEVSNG